MHFFRHSRHWVLKVDLGTQFRDKHGHLFLWDLELFWPSFKDDQTKVENMHFCLHFQKWNLKVDLDTHFNKQAYTLTVAMFQAISLPLSATLVKAHDTVSLLTNFLELKYDHRFRCPFGRSECMPNLVMFRALFPSFKPNLRETAWRSFTFDQIPKM